MLRSLIENGTILIDPTIGGRDELFSRIATEAHAKGNVTSAQEFRRALVEREEQMSTEIESGIALPHARTDAVRRMFLCIIVSGKGIKFGAFGSRVKITFLLGAPKEAPNYLDIMAMIARVLGKKQFRHELMHARSGEQVLAAIDEFSVTREAEKPDATDRHGLFLALNDAEEMETAMKLAIELGVKGTQVVESTDVAAKIALDFPFLSLFAGRSQRISSRTLFGVIEDPKIAGRLYAHLKKEGIDVRAPGAGILFTMPLGVVFGGVDQEFY
jgi:mannitol/fructose-specific phosphotransferase system IIA component (Ntr-type)